MTEKHKPGLICPKCEQLLFPMRESPEFPDATYTETCPYCFEEYSYTLESGKVSLWEPPKNTSQSYKGKGTAGGKTE